MKQDERKILLIEPPFYRLFKDTYSLDRYPLSLGYLAGTIKVKTNWDVMAYNADFYPHNDPLRVSYLAGDGFHNYLKSLENTSHPIWDEIRSVISEYNPRVVGISTKAQNFASACMVSTLAKQFNPEILVIAGGPYPSMVGVQALDCPDIDIAVRGEGENTILELLNAVEDNRKLEEIQGLVYRSDSGIVETEPREFIDDLDSLCFPHESAPQVLKDYKHYPLSAFRYIFTIRGCPYNCFFCGSREIWSRKPRFRSVNNVIEEIKGLQEMGLKTIEFADDTFGIDKQHINDMCDALIRHCPGLEWRCELPVKLVEDKTLSLMKKAGCRTIQIGIESGNNEILKKIRKNITIEDALSTCELITKHGIRLEVFFIIGFPQDTEETLNDTADAMKKVKCDKIIYSIFTPYPGTEAFEFCKENGLIHMDYDVSLYNHQSPSNCFCMNIQPDDFRKIASRIERMVDKKNSRNKIKRIFSSDSLAGMREVGIGESLQRGVKALVGK
jgi:radical SAM superfamily enzyme YgiQ (UPF0313 family)